MQDNAKKRGMSFKDEREPVIVHYDLELDDAGLDPYQFRAYQRIARRCTGATTGQCFESLESMAEGCKMSRPTLIRAVKVLIERGMIRRLSRQGMTSFYALADKKNWINLANYEAQKGQQPGKPESQVTREPGKPESQGVVNQRVRGGKPESQGGGSHVYTKKTHEEYTEEDKKESAPPPVSDVSAIWQEVLGDLITIHAQETLESAVSDLNAFRRTLEIWKTNSYSRRNLAGILNRYETEVSESQTKQTVSANNLRLVDQMPAGLDDFAKTRWLKEQLAKGAAA